MHNANHTLKFEDITPKAKYWEDYLDKVKVLKSMLDNWEGHKKMLTARFADTEALRRETQVVPAGFLSWDDGDIRQIIRKYYESNDLPPPALSPQAWHAIWIKHEREAKNTVDLAHTLAFAQLFTEDLHALVTNQLKPVEVAPKTFVPAEKDAKQDWHKDYNTKQIQAVKKVVDEWDDDHIQETVAKCFASVDDGDGALKWNNSEIRKFIVKIFSAHQVPLPKLSDSQWYLLYRKFDKDGNGQLSRKECEEFVKMVHQEIVNKETDWEHMGQGAGKLEHGQVTGQEKIQLVRGTGPEKVEEPAKPAERCPVTTRVQQSDWRGQYEPHHVDRAQDKLDKWDSPNIKNTITDIFHTCDKDGSSTLAWNNSEIKHFVEEIFKAKGLNPPNVPESVWYQMYREVDHNGDYVMNQDEAAEFALHVLQRVLQMNNVPVSRPLVPQQRQVRVVQMQSQPQRVVMVR